MATFELIDTIHSFTGRFYFKLFKDKIISTNSLTRVNPFVLTTGFRDEDTRWYTHEGMCTRVFLFDYQTYHVQVGFLMFSKTETELEHVNQSMIFFVKNGIQRDRKVNNHH